MCNILLIHNPPSTSTLWIGNIRFNSRSLEFVQKKLFLYLILCLKTFFFHSYSKNIIRRPFPHQLYQISLMNDSLRCQINPKGNFFPASQIHPSLHFYTYLYLLSSSNNFINYLHSLDLCQFRGLTQHCSSWDSSLFTQIHPTLWISDSQI